MNEGRNNKRTDILPKVFSVIAAVILWFYVIDMRTTTEEMTLYAVPISITNFSYADGLDIVSGKDFTVDVQVRGKKSDLSSISVQDVYASVDMSGIDYAGTHKMDVDVVSLKSGVTVSNKNISVINVNVDRNVADVVPVETVLLYTIEEDIYEMGTPVLSFENVRVTGPQKVVELVVKAKAELNIGKIENNITLTGKLKLYDENEKVIESPYLKLSEDVLKVEIPVYKTEIKNVEPVFYDENYAYEYTVSPASVYVKGSVGAVQSMKNACTVPVTDTVPMLVVKRLDLPVGTAAYDENGNVIDTVRINITSVTDLTVENDEAAQGEGETKETQNSEKSESNKKK